MQSESTQIQYMSQQKSPDTAILLSFFICGAGQIYNGEVGKGIGMIIASIFLLAGSALILPLFFLIPLWIWGMVDANKKANAFNEVLTTSPLFSVAQGFRVR